MTLTSYLKAVRERWYVVVAITISGIAIAATIHLATPAEYQASTSLFVSSQTDGSSDSAYQGGLFSEQRVKSYAELALNDRVRNSVNQRMGSAYSSQQYRAKVSANSQLDSVVLTISAVDEDPVVAANLANNVGIVLRDLVNELERPVQPNDPQRVTTRIVDAASVPETPTSLRLIYALGLGLIIGAAIGVGVAVLWSLMDTSIRSVEELKRLSNAPNLAVVPRSDSIPFDPEKGIVGSVPEPYRQLRTALQFIDIDEKRKAIIVSSAMPSEGKSTTAANLAVALSAGGSRTLLLDADLRRPRVAEEFGLEQGVGLTSVLTGRVDIESAIQFWGRGNLAVLTSGPVPPNPSELLGSLQMTNLIQKLRGRFEYVVVDSPPILPVADTSALAHSCDGVILAIKHGSTSSHQLEQTVESLDTISVKILGTVLTVVPPRRVTGSGYQAYGPYTSISTSEEMPWAPENAKESSITRPTPQRRA